MTTTPVTSITDEQLAEIERLASKATQGKWWIDSHGHTMVSLDNIDTIFETKGDPKDAVRHEETGNLSFWRNDWDATYIANACPKNILALITRLRAAEQDAKRLMYACKDLDGFMHVLKDKYDFAIDCANENGREEPNEEDELNGLRRLIDAAILSEHL